MRWKRRGGDGRNNQENVFFFSCIRFLTDTLWETEDEGILKKGLILIKN